MSYSATRDAEQLRRMDTSIAAFVQRYNDSSTPQARRRTLILLVGGGGSRLIRARKKYLAGGGPGQTFTYDPVWLDAMTLLQVQLLRMHPVARQQDHDLGDRIVIADGAVELFTVTPYAGFTAWCDLQGIDWFVYGWDWRRPLVEMASFFVGRFLPYFRNQVELAGCPDPLGNLVLLGHSSGGMVLDLALRQSAPVLDGLTHAISVCTPFYGYGGQLHRWFEGQPPFNFPTTLDTVKTISSFAGTYALMYLDRATFIANQIAFAADAPYALLDYPSKDAATALDVDAYHPVGRRYPAGSGFSTRSLAAGLTTYSQLAAGPCAAYAGIFYNIRGVQDVDSTTGSITWAQLPAGYHPGGAFRPIRDTAAPVPGDGTQPAWTARLLSLPKTQWITVRGNIEHMFMLDYPETLTAIGKLLGVTTAAMKRKPTQGVTPPPPPATSAEVLDFARQLQKLQVEDAANAAARVAAVIDTVPLARLKAIARRLLIDIAKGPAGAPDAPPAPPGRGSGRTGAGRRPRRK